MARWRYQNNNLHLKDRFIFEKKYVPLQDTFYGVKNINIKNIVYVHLKD